MTGVNAVHSTGRPAPPEVRAWWTLAAGAVLLRFVVMPFGGFPSDITTFKAWATSLAEAGPTAFYRAGFADYLPGYLYVLWGIGEINRAVRFNDPAFLFALKVPALIADVLTSLLLLIIARRARAPRALAIAASYLFNPGVFFNGAVWGQADAVGALVALLGVMLLDAGPPLLATGLLTAAVLIKPQTAPVLVPATLFLLRTLSRPASGPRRWDLLAGAAGASALVFLAIIAPFGLGPLGLVRVLRTSLGVYPYGSVVAFNFWGAVQGFWVSDGVRWLGVPLYALGAAATLIVLAIIGTWTWRHPRPEAVVLAAAAALIAAFVLPTRIHERYLLPALAFLAAAGATNRRALWIYAGLSILFTANLLYAYTRPYLQTFLLPGWLEGTLFSAAGARLLSVLVALALPAVLWVLLRSRPDAPSDLR